MGSGWAVIAEAFFFNRGVFLRCLEPFWKIAENFTPAQIERRLVWLKKVRGPLLFIHVNHSSLKENFSPLLKKCHIVFGGLVKREDLIPIFYAQDERGVQDSRQTMEKILLRHFPCPFLWGRRKVCKDVLWSVGPLKLDEKGSNHTYNPRAVNFVPWGFH